MKKLIFAITFLLALATSAFAFGNAFCDGYKAGYQSGYCYGEYSCIKPIPPICPIPRIGEKSYQDGYNRGFLVGTNSK